MDDNESKVPAEPTIFADPDPATIEMLVDSSDEAFEAAESMKTQLRLELTPEEALEGGINTTAQYVLGRGFGDPGATAWAWIFEPVFDLPSGWSTDGADPEGAALARESFGKELATTVVSIPDAETILAAPILAHSESEPGGVVGGMIAVPLLGDSEPDPNCMIAVATIAGVVGMQMDNSVRTSAAARSLQFAQAAARTQRLLVEPHDRASALAVAIDSLAECDALIGARATEINEEQEREVKTFGDIDAPLDGATTSIDDAELDAAREAGRATLAVMIEGVQEAEIVLQSRLALGDVELDTLNSVASAVAGTVSRFRASATIESLRRSATRRLVEAQERERSMVAADIHDGVLQQLGATAIRLELAQSRVEQRDFDTASSIIADGANEIRSCARELRALLMELRPQVLDDNGLNAALIELGRHVEGVEIVVNSAVPEELGSEFSITIFRIVQEALTNIQKHAQATHATVDVSLRSDEIEIEISDDGVGYEGAVTGPSAEGSHLGLLGMRERAQMFGGTFSIEGASGGGTEIHATLPLDGMLAREI
jgi:signal transduction histidine kinase